MARNVEVTNLSRGPRGWHEVGATKPTVLRRGQTETLTVSDHVFSLMQKDAAKSPPDLELADLGDVRMDGDGDQHMGGSKKAAAPAAPVKALATDVGQAGIIADLQAKLLAAQTAQTEALTKATEAETARAAEETARLAAEAALTALKADAGTADATQTDDAAAAAANPAGGDDQQQQAPAEGEYTPSLPFETFDIDQLKKFLDAAEVEYHPATGQRKLLDKALATDRAQWDAAQAAKAAGADANDEAV